jgi:hypothetical protein
MRLLSMRGVLAFGFVVSAGVACSATSDDNQFAGETSGDTGSGAGTGQGGDLGLTTTSAGTGAGVLGEEPKCDGVDPSIDNDGDGWTGAAGDCNDCTWQMNPGAQDYPGNAIDEDCNGAKDDNPTACDGAVPIDSTDPLDATRALGLCKMQQGAGWGVISAKYVMADGGPLPDPLGHGVLGSFGPNVLPQEGFSMLALSSGASRTPSDPNYMSPGGYDKFYQSGTPAGYPKESPSCPGVITGEAHDSAALEVVIQSPTNAKSLHFNLDFYTYEFPYFICSSYNDFFVAMLSPQPSGLPDGNISFDSQGNTISVNAGFLEVCTPQFAGGKDFPCSLGPAQLAGTGFDDDINSAATGWLVTNAPVEDPGGTVTLLFAIWDSGDGILDSTVLLDNFGFDVEEAPTQTTPVPPPK